MQGEVKETTTRATRIRDKSKNSVQQEQQRNSFCFIQVVSLLDLVRNSIKRVPEAAALFYDELANVIEKRQLDPKTEVNCMMMMVMVGDDDGGRGGGGGMVSSVASPTI
jgi:hypothetical protein